MTRLQDLQNRGPIILPLRIKRVLVAGYKYNFQTLLYFKYTACMHGIAL